MRRSRIYNPLLLSLGLVVGGLLAVGCSCDDDEFDGAEACQKLVDAANSVLGTCGASEVNTYDVCGSSTSSCSSISGCTPKVDVEACVTFIKSLSCDGVQARNYSNATACVDILSNISSSCATSDGDDDDIFDD